MKKLILSTSISFVIALIAGNAFWYLASPSFAASETDTVVARGSFVDADSVHRGEGVATIYASTTGQHTLQFSEFKVTNGPDLEVWLVAHPDIKSSEDVTNSEWFSLGKLKANTGDQNYHIPAEVDVSRYQSAVVWCEQFSVLFASATLSSP